MPPACGPSASIPLLILVKMRIMMNPVLQLLAMELKILTLESQRLTCMENALEPILELLRLHLKLQECLLSPSKPAEN